jgi:hypothetical protein
MTWSYVAGEKGRNRVRVFERGRLIWVDFCLENGRRVSEAGKPPCGDCHAEIAV